VGHAREKPRKQVAIHSIEISGIFRAMNSLEEVLRDKLTQREQAGALRSLKITAMPRELGNHDFSSNDYLGLARSTELTDAINRRVAALPHAGNGATGSRLLTGNNSYTQEVEASLASLFKAPASLIFNSGYSANLSVLSSLPQKDDTILYDELAHTCIKDGARLSLARRFSFRHNDMNDLEARLSRATGRVYIAVESVYSMDGDTCPLQELVPLAERYNATVILDEAHSTGAMGPDGSGMAVDMNLHERIGIRVYTFGKAMGIHGACVAGSENLVRYLVNFARPFIYTTAMPPHSIAAIECSFAYLQQHIYLQQALRSKTELYLQHARLGNRILSTSAIQTALFPGNQHCREAATALQSQGFDIRPILSPTVPQGAERLRICLHTYNTNDSIHQLCAALHQLATQFTILPDNA